MSQTIGGKDSLQTWKHENVQHCLWRFRVGKGDMDGTSLIGSKEKIELLDVEKVEVVGEDEE